MSIYSSGNKTATVIGVGNIGFRYLQALLSLTNIEKIYLVEPNISLIKSKLKEERFNNKKVLVYKKQIDNEVVNVDLIIVSTTSNIRIEIIKWLLKFNSSCPLILEKFLFPDSYSFEEGKKLLIDYPSPIYVNEWMRITLLKEIISQYKDTKAEFQFIGTFGILCNAVHIIDLIKETLNIDDFRICETDSYLKSIINSKREGYNEFKGIISYKSKNYILKMIDIDDDLDPKIIKIIIKSNNKEKIYYIDLPDLKDGENKVIGQIPYLSEHAKESISSILNNLIPVIPNFDTAIEHHELLIEALKKMVPEEDLNKIKIT